MKIVKVKTNAQRKTYIDFLYSIYQGDSEFCDMNVIFVKNFLYRRDDFAKSHKVLPIMIYDNNTPKLECMFIVDETEDIKLSFIEFLPHSEKYLRALMKYSIHLMEKLDKNRVIIGINGQISYGLGILTADYNRKFEFNSNYNPAYYTREMDAVFPVVKRAFSYEYDVKHTLKCFNPELIEKNNQEFSFRYFDTRHFKREMMLFGQLVHDCLKTTPYYSKKTPYQMYQLMNQTRLFFRKKDIIFAMKNGKEIGFIYTHPDYAEFFNKGRLNYITFYLRFLTGKTSRVIYNVIGVLPDYQRSGVAVNLVEQSIRFRKKDYRYGCSSFILEENKESTSLCRKIATGINKEFHLYEIPRNRKCIK